MKSNRTLLLIGAGIVGFGYLLIALPPWQVDQGILEVFFGVFGVIYAIVAGFVVLVLLENYSAIRAHMWAEINALQDLRDYLIYVDNQDDVVDEVKTCIRVYVQSVIDTEWPQMAASGVPDMDTSPELYAVMESINPIRRTDDSDAVALTKLIDTLGDITTHRTDRLASSAERLPFLLTSFIVILSVLVVFVFALMPIQEPIVRFLLNGINLFAVAFIYLIIWDLSHPFQGAWSISCEPYESLAAKLATTKNDRKEAPLP